jgi:hypothetical protein
MSKFGSFLSSIGHDIVSFVEKLPGLADKFARIISAEQKLEPEFINAAKVAVADGAALVATVAPAIAAKGSSWIADSAAVAAVEKYAADFPIFAKAVEDAVKALES